MTDLVVRGGGAAAAAAPSQEWLSAARKAKALSWLSLVWMSLEGGIAIAAGIAAGSIAHLAAAVFLGLAGNALFGWWWLDPVAALAIAGIALREGVETWRGEGCCAAPELTPAAAKCEDERCSDDG